MAGLISPARHRPPLMRVVTAGCVSASIEASGSVRSVRNTRGLRSATAVNAVASGVRADSGQGETGSDRAATTLQANFRPYPPSTGTSIQEPARNTRWTGPQSQPEALGQILGAVLFLRSTTDHLSLGRPCQGRKTRNFTHSSAERNRRTSGGPARPLPALTVKVRNTPGPEARGAMERRTPTCRARRLTSVLRLSARIERPRRDRAKALPLRRRRVLLAWHDYRQHRERRD
jgi:hypothetical protein